MELKFKMAYLKSICERYHQVSKRLKGKILDEFCKVCGYDRKYAIQKLNGPNFEDKAYLRQKRKSLRRRPVLYGPEVINLLSKVWEAAGYPCSTRLESIIPLWLPWIEKHFQPSNELKMKLLKISSRQMDRRLRSRKLGIKKRIYGCTKPGTLLKHHIPIKTDHWDVDTPGFTEVDTVSHSGNNADGAFAYSVNQTDILTGWVETRAVLGKAEKGVNQALEEMEIDFPFKILGIDSDNGSEFINYSLWIRCEQQKIQFTRGRPYKKDDNAHIEQKNWTHVRKLMGWNRYDSREAVDLMNDLYKNELRLFMNLFMPSAKLLKKERVGSRLIRCYDEPKTPLDRVIASKKGDPANVARLKALRIIVDPFELSRIIDRNMKRIFEKANYRQSPKSSGEARETLKKQPAKLSYAEKDIMKDISRIFGIKALVS
jgi:hypothetical protein